MLRFLRIILATPLYLTASLLLLISLRIFPPDIREKASDIVALMTPAVKSFFTDTGVEITNNAMQIFGGYGYIKEYGMEYRI